MPEVAITSRGPVRSVCLFHRRPLQQVRRVALDSSSRTSAALLRVLLRERLGRDPEYVAMPPSLPDMLAVVEGEESRLDLGQEWTERTGLPFVWAFWAGRREAAAPSQVARLQAALAEGLENLPAIASTYNGAGGAALNERYLRSNIVYRLGEPEVAGLNEFYRRAFGLGLIARVPELRFYGGG